MVSILFNSVALHDIWMDPCEEAPESLSPTLALSPVLVPGSLDSYTPIDGSSSVAAFIELDGKLSTYFSLTCIIGLYASYVWTLRTDWIS